MSLTRRIISICRKNDWLYLRLRRLNRLLVYWRSVISRKARRGLSRPNFEIGRTLRVSPERIQYKPAVRANKFIDAGKVVSGHWDRENLTPFSEYLGICDGIAELCEGGKHWNEIPFFKEVAAKIANGGIHWGCRNVEDMDDRTAAIKALYEDIRSNGYRTQDQLHADSDDSLKDTRDDEISVHIGRDGRFLFDDGAHRLAIAKLLRLPEVPVKVVHRHAEWVAFRQEILDYASSQGGNIYHAITHPDLQDIPRSHGDERFDLIRPHLPEGGGTVLDIGAHWGYFCHKLEGLGFDCCAVEMDRLHFRFLDKLAEVEERQFRRFNISIFEFDARRHFDVMLAMNIFYHFIKFEETHQKLVEFLGRVTADVIFFQPHLTRELAGQDAYRNYTASEFVDFVLEHSGLQHATEIGQDNDGRPIYKLERQAAAER